MACGKRKSNIYTFLDLMAVGIGNTGGIGIFVLLGELTKNVAGPATIISIAVAAVAALLAGLCFAEFGSRFVKADTVYLYSYAYHGENVAFIFGWALTLQLVAGPDDFLINQRIVVTPPGKSYPGKLYPQLSDIIWPTSSLGFLGDTCAGNSPFLTQFPHISNRYMDNVTRSASVAKGIMTFVDALTHNEISNFLDGLIWTNTEYGFSYLDIFSPIIIIVLTILLIAGMKDSLLLRYILTSFTVLLILSIIIGGSFRAGKENWFPSGCFRDRPHGFFPFGLLGILRAAALAFYGFIGFDSLTVTGKEVANPKKLLPLNVTTVIFVVFLLYGGVCVILTLIHPYMDHIEAAALPFAFEHLKWYPFKWVVAVGAFSSFYSSLLGVTFELPKTIHSMATDGLLFRFLGKQYFKHQISLWAALIGSTLASIGACLFEFKVLVSLTAFVLFFLSTILAIDLTVLRYTISDDTMANPSEGTQDVLHPNGTTSASQMLALLFSSASNLPTRLTEKIVVTNMLFFCASSLGLVVIFTSFSDSLVGGAVGTIIPTAILSVILLFTLCSMMCQPKPPCSSPFKVPFVPLLPCFSIFLNLLLMSLLGSLSIIYFGIWMLTGMIPYFTCYCFKYCRGDLRSNSVFEINKLNALKLNDSILKINMDKKTFYEGAINPVFETDEPNITPLGNDDHEDSEKDSITPNHITEHITATVVSETFEEVDLKHSPVEVEKAPDNETTQLGNSQVDDEGVQWKCVAEIHTEDDLPEESYEMQVVDNTYNFLSHMVEEIGKDDVSDDAISSESDNQKGKRRDAPMKKEEDDGKESEGPKTSETSPQKVDNSTSPEPEETEKSNADENSKGERDLNDEHIKEFKEKLNILLKNQINMNDTLKRAISKYRSSSEEEWDESYEKSDGVQHNIKTLNKSQMKNKLEFLLAKGPPKRYSLRNSFNIKVKETDEKSLTGQAND
ncbi:hypothetical protein RUM43_013646 [Polyplax serrata]|uniref:Uncharacterized protein n=1 Tax=Polyplax serrata TaxID=468196 RepID=A0AAN8RZ02_POLSC